jgi:hypothetical protein
MTLNMAESSFLPLSPKHLITGILYLQKANLIKQHLQQEFSLLFMIKQNPKKILYCYFNNQNVELDGCRAAKWVGGAGEEEHHQSSSSKWSR